MREWQYWTRNKLAMLEAYLPTFNRASMGKASERIYLDLMAGEIDNVDAQTGERFDGSPLIALKSSPGFTRLAFGEMPAKAIALERQLREEFPESNFEVYAGDCNETVDAMLHDLAKFRWAPTFAFVDQQAAEIQWSTLEKLARFRSGSRKVELWILVSPAMTAKGVAGTNSELFAARVDALYGTDAWREIRRARTSELIDAPTYRAEMVNLLRWRLERKLGYAYTSRIPLRMPSGVPIYDMVFATDHQVGRRIMDHLYAQAAARQPSMIAAAKARAASRRDAKKAESTGATPLFELRADDFSPPAEDWQPDNPWGPANRAWWTAGDAALD